MLSYTDAYKKAVYGITRTCDARLSFTLDGVTTNFDSTDIVSFKITEELSIISDAITSNELVLTMDNTNGDWSFLTNSNVDLIIAKRPYFVVEAAVKLDDGSYEWKALGRFYLTEWKNEIGAMTVTMTALDKFDRISQFTYSDLTSKTFTAHAQAILAQAGIAGYIIDTSILNAYSGAFTEALDCRKALQLIAIASKCLLYQDRYSYIRIKPLVKQSDNPDRLFFTYAGFSFIGVSAYSGTMTPYADDLYGMKIINYDNAYREPTVKLEKTIYEVKVNGVSYINGAITSGRSVTLDNPLIAAGAHAQSVADWLFAESAKTATYATDWRQNPVLECGDTVLIQDSFNSLRQTIVTKQVFDFNGALSGQTESKGGI